MQRRDLKAVMTKCYFVVVPGRSKALLHDCELSCLPRRACVCVCVYSFFCAEYLRGSLGATVPVSDSRSVSDVSYKMHKD